MLGYLDTVKIEREVKKTRLNKYAVGLWGPGGFRRAERGRSEADRGRYPPSMSKEVPPLWWGDCYLQAFLFPPPSPSFTKLRAPHTPSLVFSQPGPIAPARSLTPHLLRDHPDARLLLFVTQSQGHQTQESYC